MRALQLPLHPACPHSPCIALALPFTPHGLYHPAAPCTLHALQLPLHSARTTGPLQHACARDPCALQPLCSPHAPRPPCMHCIPIAFCMHCIPLHSACIASPLHPASPLHALHSPCTLQAPCTRCTPPPRRAFSRSLRAPTPRPPSRARPNGPLPPSATAQRPPFHGGGAEPGGQRQCAWAPVPHGAFLCAGERARKGGVCRLDAVPPPGASPGGSAPVASSPVRTAAMAAARGW